MTIRATIYRGEVRTALPTHTHPDPAEHLAQDPHDFLRTWMAPHYPFPEGYSGHAVTVGQHWTRSPEIIPERFTYANLLDRPQPGVPMGKAEARGVKAMLHTESAPPEGVDWDEHAAALAKSEQTVKRYEKQDINVYADLSGHSERPDAAKPYKMGIIWHGEEPEHHERGTSYEDELNLPIGSHVRVHGARLYIPPAGVHHDMRSAHPSTFTPEEHLAASLDVQHRSTYSAIGKTSSVPWNRIQFPEPISVPVEGRKYWSR